MKRILKRCLIWSAFSLLALVVGVVSIVLWDMPPLSVRQYMALQHEWSQWKPAPGSSAADRSEQRTKFAERALKIAEQNPDTPVELVALFLADKKAADTPVGPIAGERMQAKVGAASLKNLSRACMGYGMGVQLSQDRAVPAIVARTRQDLDHPKAPYLLSQCSGALAWNSELNDPPAHDPPPLFNELADLIVDRFATSSDIYNFCSSLGGGTSSPHWAPQFERHLQQILDVNKDPFVRSCAAMAMAMVVQAAEDRQAEAEEKFNDFLAEYDRKQPPQFQQVISVQCEHARMQLEAMKFASIGRSAPEIVGVDLQGETMTLSQYRGKVVMITFWATWCAPCMRMVMHEREIAAKYAGPHFAVVGINADEDPSKGLKAQTDKSLTWRSFRDKRDGTASISDEWKALFPTVYLIDHKGIVRHRYSGSPNPQQINESIARLMAEVEAD